MKTTAKKQSSRRITAIIALLLGALTLSVTGCNTVHGAGKDIEKAGDKIQDSADRHS